MLMIPASPYSNRSDNPGSSTTPGWIHHLISLEAGISGTWDTVLTVASNYLKYILEHFFCTEITNTEYQLFYITEKSRCEAHKATEKPKQMTKSLYTQL